VRSEELQEKLHIEHILSGEYTFHLIGIKMDGNLPRAKPSGLMKHIRYFCLISATMATFTFAACGQRQVDDPGQMPTQERKEGQECLPITRQKDSTMTSIAYLSGHFEPAKHLLFAPIPRQFATRDGMFLRKEALEAFIRMHRDAAQAGHELRILSATRNFEYQQSIWAAKWGGARLLSDGTNAALDIADPKERALRILEYSAMPGTSRHHWGTDIDLNALDNSYFETGQGQKLFQWLETHASEYGFCRPYTAYGDGRESGYREEKWHWSYLPLSAEFVRIAERELNNSHITGFPGAETANHIDVVRRYVLGVNQRCK